MKHTLLLLCVVGAHMQALACDVCGGASGSYLGILPRFNDHFIGLSAQYQQFNSTHPVMTGAATPVESANYTRSITAWGRFYPLRRLQVFAFVPYVYNTAVEPTETVLMDGLGDVRVLANYMVLDTRDSDSRVQHTLLAGGGIKAPTGRNDVVNTEGIILSNMQPGTGSWDLVANINYTLRAGKAGVNADASYRYCTTNARDYRYGDRVNGALTGFYWLETGSISLLPQAGARYEYSAVDLSSNYYRIRNTYSGGTQVYATAGATLYTGNLAVGVMASLPAWQHFAGGLVQSKTRCEVQLQYLIKNKKNQ